MEILHVVSKQPIRCLDTGGWKIQCHILGWLRFEDPEVAELLIKKSRQGAKSFTLDEAMKDRSLDYND